MIYVTHLVVKTMFQLGLIYLAILSGHIWTVIISKRYERSAYFLVLVVLIYPDDYEISGNKQTAVKQIGNSVPPQLARMMAIAIRQQIFKTVFPFELSVMDVSEKLTFRNRKRELTAIYKKKAEIAIKALKEHRTIRPNSHSYYCSMTDNFAFREVKKDIADYAVDVCWDESLKINVTPINRDQSTGKIQIVIVPVCANWSFTVSSVILTVYGGLSKDFTAAWKAFDHELIINSIKADIIQLNGYYQYIPKMKSSCTLPDEFPYREIVAKIVSGENVANIRTAQELSRDWNISEALLCDVAEFLRKIGYEIRNHNTNPQIDEDNWLIPYAFPTLTPQSVQLRKKVK